MASIATHPEISIKSCFHCGEDLDHNPVRFDGKSFCCLGCKTVFEILDEHQLCAYYSLSDNPGKTQKSSSGKDYSYLDDENILAKLLNFKDDRTSQITLYLPQIHCASCIWLLENLNKINPAILNSRVNYPKRELTLSYLQSETSLKKIAELLDHLTYPPLISLSDTEKQPRPVNDPGLIYRLGLAGFCFGNIMLLSFPDYLGMDFASKAQFSAFFGFLNLVLAIPVLSYSSTPFLRNAWMGISHKQINLDIPISLGILALFGRSLFEVISGTGTGYFDSFAGLVFFLLAGRWFQQRVYHHLSFDKDYRSWFPIAVTVLQNGKWSTKAFRELRPGDHVRIRNQEMIPSDGILKKSHALINYSFVTGESDPVNRTEGDLIYAGGRVLGSSVEMIVSRKPDQSYLIRLWDNPAFNGKFRKNTARIADTVGKYFTVSILLIAIITLFYWLPLDTNTAINSFSAVLIVACPCAIALAIPFTQGNLLRLMARNKLYLKSTSVVEALAKANQIVFDKTGTLTSNDEPEIEWIGKKLTKKESSMLAGLVSHSGHPKSVQIAKFLDRFSPEEIDSYREIPGNGISGISKGHTLALGSADFQSQYFGIDLLSTDGLFFSVNQKLKGRFIIRPKIRHGVKTLIGGLSKAFPVSLLSGDNQNDKIRFGEFFHSGNQMFFNQNPEDKMNFIRGLQSEGKKVLMIGDGLNDAGALAQSDIGMVISDDVNNFSPSCDALIDSESLSLISPFIRLSRIGNQIIIAAFILSLAYNLIGLSFAVQGLLTPLIAAILMPLSSVSVVLFGVLAGNISARLIGLKN